MAELKVTVEDFDWESYVTLYLDGREVAEGTVAEPGIIDIFSSEWPVSDDVGRLTPEGKRLVKEAEALLMKEQLKMLPQYRHAAWKRISSGAQWNRWP